MAVTFTEVIESLQTEQENTTKAVQSLDNRMLEFISLSKRGMLEDLEDRREARRQARAGGFFGMGAAGAGGGAGRDQQNPFSVGNFIQGFIGARVAMAALGALSTALLSGGGLLILGGIAAAVVGSLGLKSLLEAGEQRAKEEIAKDPIKTRESAALDSFLETGSVEEAKRLLTQTDTFGEDPAGRIADIINATIDRSTPESVARNVALRKALFAAEQELKREARDEIAFGATPGMRTTADLTKVPEMEQMQEFLANERRTARYPMTPDTLTGFGLAPTKTMTVEEAQRSFNLQNIDGSPVAPLTPAEIETERADVAKQIEASEERQMGLIRRLIGVIGFGKAETRDEIRQRLSAENYLTDLVPQPAEVQASTRNVDGLLKAAANYIDRIVRFAAMTSDIIPPDPNDPNYGRLMEDFMLLDEASRRGVPIAPLVNPQGQMLNQMSGDLGVGGVTINNITTNNNVSGGGGGSAGGAVNAGSSTAAPSNEHPVHADATQIMSGGPNR